MNWIDMVVERGKEGGGEREEKIWLTDRQEGRNRLESSRGVNQQDQLLIEYPIEVDLH